jgi:hypothetical protein
MRETVDFAVVKFGYLLENLSIRWYVNNVKTHPVQTISRKDQGRRNIS